MLRRISRRGRSGSDPQTEDVSRGSKKTYAVAHCQAISLADIGRRTFSSVDRVMAEEQKNISLTFDKVSPYLEEVFTELANHDVRFEFDPVSDGDPRCTMISKKVYSVVCCLRQLPDEYLRVEGNDTEGALSVRLSGKYAQKYEEVCWDDLLTSPDSNGRRYLSTAKVQQVLTSSIKHAISDVLAANAEKKNLSIKCSIKKHLLIVGIKVDSFTLSFNILPGIEVGRKGSESFAINAKIAKVLKQFEMDSPDELYLIAQPVPDYPEKLWRINVNQLENKLIAKLGEQRGTFNHCLYTINLLNEEFYATKRSSMLLPLRYIRTSLVVEALKFFRQQNWEPYHFVERIESVLSRLEAHLNKRQFSNIFTGVNLFSGREPATLGELSRCVMLFREASREFLLNFDGRRRTRSLPAENGNANKPSPPPSATAE